MGGHILEWRVRWRSNGYSLGDIAKTLTLAPRQKKRIVKLSWERSQSARRSESTGFRESVRQGTTSSRSYANAVQGSLSEWSKGSSYSRTRGSAGGLGIGGIFGSVGFAIGGGSSRGSATSTSSQQGARRVAVAEQQSLRDSIRQFGDSVRRLESTVIEEVSQEESIEGISEVIRNPNYCHALTVIYYEILRHLRVDTELTSVSECLFIPMAVIEFTKAKIAEHRDVLRDHVDDKYRAPLNYAPVWAQGEVAWNANADIPEARKDQPLTSVSGSVFVRLKIERPYVDETSAAT